MKRYAIFLLVAIAIISGLFSLSWGQSPEETNDPRQSNTFYAGADIENRVEVYFDYNPPVSTNTVHNRDFLCGDANSNGVINMGDVVYLINYLFKMGDPPDPYEAGNVNGDEVIDIGDVVYFWNYLFKSGPVPDCPPE